MKLSTFTRPMRLQAACLLFVTGGGIGGFIDYGNVWELVFGVAALICAVLAEYQVKTLKRFYKVYVPTCRKGWPL